MVKKINSCAAGKNESENAIIAAAEKIYKPILNCGISNKFIERSVKPIISEVKKHAAVPDANEDRIIKFLKDSLCDLIKIKPPFDINERVTTPRYCDIARDRRIVVMTGTCGVGKTCTIAKLATRLTLNLKKKTALFTIDTYRVAATHQISIFSDIIGIPYEIIFKKEDLAPALDKYPDQEVILIDTIGITTGNVLDHLHLRSVIGSIAGLKTEIYLVLSAATKLKDSWSILKNYHSAFNIKGLIFTQTDNTERFDEIFAITAESGIPIAYLGNGQNVPDDIMIPTAEYILNKIVNLSSAENYKIGDEGGNHELNFRHDTKPGSPDMRMHN
jgi:flagellar biosynthesis GTPase FlhF